MAEEELLNNRDTMSIWSFLTSISTDEWSAFGTVITGLATVVLVITAFLGVRQWRIQLTGTNKYDIARRLALLGLQFRDEFSQARSPLTFAQESADRSRREGETRDEAQINDEYYARRMRLKTPTETLQKMRATAWEAEILLGKDAQELVGPFEEALQDLISAIEMHFYYRHEDLKRSRTGIIIELPDDEKKKRNEFWRIVYRGGENDELSLKVNEATQYLKTYLQTFIK